MSIKDAVVNRGLLILAQFRHSNPDQVDGVIALELCFFVVVGANQKVSELKISKIRVTKCHVVLVAIISYLLVKLGKPLN